MSPESESSTPQPAKQPSSPGPEMHWIVAAITQGWPAMKKFIVHFAFFATGALLVYCLYQSFVIPGKDATIASLQQQKEKLNTDLQREDRENDKLRNENALKWSAHDEKSFPLKKRAKILAKQINEFADAVEKGTIDFNQRQNEWNQRFIPRIGVILVQLDELGQHSERLEQEQNVLALMNQFPSVAKEIAKEINKLADNLPDSDSP